MHDAGLLGTAVPGEVTNKSTPLHLRYLSFGAGVQSTALLVMSALGLRGCPKADFAVFSDTQDEPAYVYEHLARMQAWGEAHGLPVHVTTRGRLSEVSGGRFLVPIFVEGTDGRASMTWRKCTHEYKLQPIIQFVRRRLGILPGQRVGKGRTATALIGISIDESQRMKPPLQPWMTNVYPLVDAGMTRSACLALLDEHGIELPSKSACVFCAFHSDSAWVQMRDDHPTEWARAVAFDEQIRDMASAGIQKPAYLHRSLIPLREVAFDSRQQRFDLEGFGNDCEGMCGV